MSETTYELLVVSSTVTNPDRLGVLVTGQMVERLLLEIFTTVNGVHTVQLARDYQSSD